MTIQDKIFLMIFGAFFATVSTASIIVATVSTESIVEATVSTESIVVAKELTTALKSEDYVLVQSKIPEANASNGIVDSEVVGTVFNNSFEFNNALSPELFKALAIEAMETMKILRNANQPKKKTSSEIALGGIKIIRGLPGVWMLEGLLALYIITKIYPEWLGDTLVFLLKSSPALGRELGNMNANMVAGIARALHQMVGDFVPLPSITPTETSISMVNKLASFLGYT